MECTCGKQKDIKHKHRQEEEKKKFLGENARAFYGFEELEVPEKITNMVE